MKKRLFSILLALCMVLCLVPTTAFAESETEETPVCTCETACTTDNMDKECPVCGAENAIPQNCGQYIPVEDRTGENGSTERADDPNGPTELSAADQVQAMIDGLPNAEEITEDNAEEVKAQLEAIDEAKEKLSDEEIDELDMTRYAEAAAALGALAAPMLLANDSPAEQFSLTPGGRYYFDLSTMNIPGTANSGNSDGAVSLPDTSLHYVPFTYAGTIEAYKLTSATATTEEYAQQNKYPHSLFVADYAVTHKVNWNNRLIYSIILYDAVAGGAGHVRRIVTKDGAAFQNVLHAAYDLVQGCDCDTSCYKCLRNYYNQKIHDQLDRHIAANFIKPWLGVMKPIEEQQQEEATTAECERNSSLDTVLHTDCEYDEDSTSWNEIIENLPLTDSDAEWVSALQKIAERDFLPFPVQSAHITVERSNDELWPDMAWPNLKLALYTSDNTD